MRIGLEIKERWFQVIEGGEILVLQEDEWMVGLKLTM